MNLSRSMDAVPTGCEAWKAVFIFNPSHSFVKNPQLHLNQQMEEATLSKILTDRCPEPTPVFSQLSSCK